MNKIGLMFVFLGLLILMGCGGSTQAGSSSSGECTLSSLKFSSVTVTGDESNMTAAAIERDLLYWGAKKDPAGVKIVGDVKIDNQVRIAVVRAEGAPFVGTATANNILIGQNVGAEIIARKISDDFCKCAFGQKSPPKTLKQ